jgi:membrane-associated phospholipid phosphatase
LRLAAVLLAAAIGLSRVMAFRHWLSDVVASACLGLLAAWMAAAMVQSVDAQPVGDIPAQPAVHDLVDQ